MPTHGASGLRRGPNVAALSRQWSAGEDSQQKGVTAGGWQANRLRTRREVNPMLCNIG